MSDPQTTPDAANSNKHLVTDVIDRIQLHCTVGDCFNSFDAERAKYILTKALMDGEVDYAQDRNEHA